MKTPNVGIANYEEMKARTLAIARGELKPKPDDPRAWYLSPELIAKLLSIRNCSLPQEIQVTQPESLTALAAGSMPS